MISEIIPQYYHHFTTFTAYQDRNTIERTSFYLRPKKISVADLLGYDQLFLVGEPGYGKSTLIKAFRAFLDQSGKTSVLYDGADFERLSDSPKTDYILFDALDESPNILPVFNELVTYANEHHIRLVISNRNHYLSLINHFLPNQHFNFIELLAFEDEQIFDFLTKSLSLHHYDETHVRNIIQKSKANGQRSILRVPATWMAFATILSMTLFCRTQ
jgi:energy-coupling factor transporter ATP-binding protein EcfA2